MNYKIIKPEQLDNFSQYQWFGSFSNPCYGFNVKSDVSKVLAVSKSNNTSFFVNTLYLVVTALNKIDEMRMRFVNGEIRLYDVINPTFTVMTDSGQFDNAGFAMKEDYASFYAEAKAVLNRVSHEKEIRDSYNDADTFDDYYVTCIPWLSIEGMQHPLPDGNPSSSSVPRVCWDKFRTEGDKTVFTLNITVSHCFVDGKRLCQAFEEIQRNFDNAEILLK